MDYKTLDSKLTGRCKDRRKLANNTYANRCVNNADAIAIRLHDTDVLIFYSDGRVVYDSGGWRTVTTKDRMSTYGPWPVYQRDRVWYIRDRRTDTEHEYYDGFTVNVGVVAPATYSIVRFREGSSRRTIDTGLTLDEAQAHCQREDTHGDGWFDGYTEE